MSNLDRLGRPLLETGTLLTDMFAALITCLFYETRQKKIAKATRKGGAERKIDEINKQYLFEFSELALASRGTRGDL